jgi:hypothetical protein
MPHCERYSEGVQVDHVKRLPFLRLSKSGRKAEQFGRFSGARMASDELADELTAIRHPDPFLDLLESRTTLYSGQVLVKRFILGEQGHRRITDRTNFSRL